MKEIIKHQQLLIDQIKEYCPILGDFFSIEKTLREYSEGICGFEKNQFYIERQHELKKRVSKKLIKLFGDRAEQELKIEYDEQLAINIVDHHQVLNHPLLISDCIISNIHKFLQDTKQSATIVFSSGDVPPNNYFSKNGFVFHGKKVPLFSNSERESTSYYLPKRDFDFIKRLKQQKRWDEFSRDEKIFLEKQDEIIRTIDYARCENYIDQISLIVNKTWPLLFEKKLRSNLSEVLYITQEEITTASLIDLLQEDNFISQALFDEQFRKKVISEFRGIVVTWMEEHNKGTHFFWRKHPTESRSLRMYMQGNVLTPVDERYKDLSIEMDKKTIVDLLKQKEIYPSLFMIFAVNNFYYGVKPLVGHGSLTYLNLIKESWLRILPHSDFQGESENIESVLIDTLITGITLFIEKSKDDCRAMYAHDVLYKGGITEEELRKLFDMNYSDLLATAVNGIYDYVSQKYIPKDKRIESTFGYSDYAQLIF